MSKKLGIPNQFKEKNSNPAIVSSSTANRYNRESGSQLQTQARSNKNSFQHIVSKQNHQSSQLKATNTINYNNQTSFTDISDTVYNNNNNKNNYFAKSNLN